MYTKPQSRTLPLLNSSELVILKSIALGLGLETIRNLLEISESTFKKRCDSIFTKLQVCNAYMAVKVAFQKEILMEKEFTTEKIKTKALEFATQNVDRLQKNPFDSKKTLWEFYDLLIDFKVLMDKEHQEVMVQ